MKIEAESRAMQQQATKCCNTQKLEETRKASALKPLEGMDLLTSCFQTCGIQTVREDISGVLSHLVCGNLL